MKAGHRTNASATLGIAFALLLALLYVAGYFALSDGIHSSTGWRLELRVYPTKWLSLLYWPGAKIESAITGHDIETDYNLPNS